MARNDLTEVKVILNYSFCLPILTKTTLVSSFFVWHAVVISLNSFIKRKNQPHQISFKHELFTTIKILNALNFSKTGTI